MRITQRPVADTTTFDLHGALAGPDARALLDAAVRRAVRAGASQLVVNLEGVPSMDAAGIGALVGAYNVARNTGCHFTLANVGRRVLHLLVITRLVTVFEIVGSDESARECRAGERSRECSRVAI